MKLQQHPLSAAFPAMSADDFAALVQDIKENGQREPVMVFEGMVLDGWHRYTACLQAGIKPQQFNFPADKDAVAFVLSHNLHRRHLTPSQRAAAVVACTEWAPKGRPGKAEMVSGFREKDLARAAGTSDRTIRDAKVAHRAGLTEAVKEGAMTAHEAATVARGKPEAKPAAKASKRELPKPQEPEQDEQIAEAQHTISELASENETLRDRLAVMSLMDTEEAKAQTNETLRELRALVKTLQAENESLKVTRDTYMREASEAKKSAIYWRKQAEKAAKDSA
jgi:ParB-like chromosome segregation protein Spo0J